MSRNEHASARINKIQLALWRKRPLSFKFGGIPTTFFSPFLDCKTVRIFAYLLRSSSQKEGLERGWKQRARLGRDAKNTFLFLSPHGRVRLARFVRVRLLRRFSLPISLLILRKNRLFCSLVPSGWHWPFAIIKCSFSYQLNLVQILCKKKNSQREVFIGY